MEGWKVMQIVKVALVCVLVTASLVTLPGQADSRVWYVNVEGTGDAPTINAAVDSTAVGDTVLVGPGYYFITESISIDKNISVISEEGAEQTTLHAETPILFWLFSGGVLEGFKLTNSNTAIYVAGGFAFETEVIIKNNVIQDHRDFGIKIFPLFDMEYINVTIEENTIRDIFDGTGVRINGVSNVLIRNNSILSNEVGIVAFSHGHVTISNNIINDCVYGDMRTGIRFNPGTLTLSNNIISDNYYGLSGMITLSTTISCNNVYNNYINYDSIDLMGIDGNISVDPQFCAQYPLFSGNFYLQSDSPCAPGNHPNGYSCGLIGRYPIGCGATAVEKASWGEIKLIYKNGR